MVDIVTERIVAVNLSDRISAQQADAQDLSSFAVRDFHLRLHGVKCTHRAISCRPSMP